MESQPSLLAARGLTDERDCLLSADDPLAQLHEKCGGSLPGVLAVPELLNLVRQGRELGLSLAREFTAFDGEDMVSGFARVRPLQESEGTGCELLIDNWQFQPPLETNSRDLADRLDVIDRACAEISMRLDSQQRIQFFEVTGGDTAQFRDLLTNAPAASNWVDHVQLEGLEHRQPLHWRLLDGAACKIPGSDRRWRVRLLPLGAMSGDLRGFELLLVADGPQYSTGVESGHSDEQANHTQLIGGALTPVLRQPISRVIANAETIRSRLAGPLRAEYSEYAGNIVSAGQHLNGLLDDLADLEVVEAEGFSTASEPVDMGDAARRAAGILGVRARAKNIEVLLPIREGVYIAKGEFRRVLQILINLIGNAIAYSPENSVITVQADDLAEDGFVALTVSDQGPGLSEDQAERVFEKFERLGRDNDGGSGLGLYISSRLAHIMGGALSVVHAGSGADEGGAKDEGATFRLSLPLQPSE